MHKYHLSLHLQQRLCSFTRPPALPAPRWAAYSVTCTLEVIPPGELLLLSGGVLWTASNRLAADSTLSDVTYYANALIREHLRGAEVRELRAVT